VTTPTLTLASAFDLSSRVAVVTGAASGIGRATAGLFAEAGASLVLGDIDETGLRAASEEIAAASGRPVTAVRTSVTERSDIDALIQQAVDEHGRLDIMANIAGVPHRSSILDVTDADYDRIMDINLRSVLYGCQAALKVMVAQQKGVIVNIASGAADTPSPTLGLYAMSKAAVAMLTKSLACEFGPHGIRVNAISPGIIFSNFSRPHFTNEDGSVDDDRKAAFEERSANAGVLGRYGLPTDVAWSILYAVADASSFMTGQILRPNGGAAMP
jgi:3-oxoacyl-[acyl-carrier protein] reductase